jgi:hypothetical protein
MKPAADHPIPGRHNMYHAIHRGLRYGHTQMLRRLGATDFTDQTEAEVAIAELRGFLRLAEGHMASEETVIHPAVEAAEAGSTSHAHEGHDDHEQSFADLDRLIAAVETAADRDRALHGDALYRRYARFAAADIAHMDEEEGPLLGLMQRLFTDDELRGIEGRVVARISPDKMMGYMRLILPALPAPDRLGMLREMQAGMPPVVFQAVLTEAARPALAAADFARLEQGLAVTA